MKRMTKVKDSRLNLSLCALALCFASGAFAVTKTTKTVTLVKEPIDLTLKCEQEEKRFNCNWSTVSEEAQKVAEANGGEYLSYEVVESPESFTRGKYDFENQIKVVVKYLR